MDESIDKIDAMLSKIKAFYTYLGEVIENGYNNDINDLEYLHEVVDTFYSPGNILETYSEPESEPEEKLNHFIMDVSSEDENDNISLSSNETDIEDLSDSDLFSDPPDYFSMYMKQKNKYQESKLKDSIDNYYDNPVNKENIIIFNNIENHDDKFKRFINSSFIF